MKYYMLDLYIKPQGHERTLQETAHNVWCEMGRPSVTVQPVDRSSDTPVFRFTALDLDELREVGRWYTGEDPEELEKLLRDVTMHGED